MGRFMETSGHGAGTSLRLVQLADTHLSNVLGTLETVVRTLGRVRGEDVGGGYWRPMAHPHPARRRPPELHDQDL